MDQQTNIQFPTPAEGTFVRLTAISEQPPAPPPVPEPAPMSIKMAFGLLVMHRKPFMMVVRVKGDARILHVSIRFTGLNNNRVYIFSQSDRGVVQQRCMTYIKYLQEGIDSTLANTLGVAGEVTEIQELEVIQCQP